MARRASRRLCSWHFVATARSPTQLARMRRSATMRWLARMTPSAITCWLARLIRQAMTASRGKLARRVGLQRERSAYARPRTLHPRVLLRETAEASAAPLSNAFSFSLSFWLSFRQKRTTSTSAPSSTMFCPAGISIYPSARDRLVISPDPLNAGSATSPSSFTV